MGVTPILQRRKLRHREVKWCRQSYAGRLVTCLRLEHNLFIPQVALLIFSSRLHLFTRPLSRSFSSLQNTAQSPLPHRKSVLSTHKVPPISRVSEPYKHLCICHWLEIPLSSSTTLSPHTDEHALLWPKRCAVLHKDTRPSPEAVPQQEEVSQQPSAAAAGSLLPLPPLARSAFCLALLKLVAPTLANRGHLRQHRLELGTGTAGCCQTQGLGCWVSAVGAALDRAWGSCSAAWQGAAATPPHWKGPPSFWKFCWAVPAFLSTPALPFCPQLASGMPSVTVMGWGASQGKEQWQNKG